MCGSVDEVTVGVMEKLPYRSAITVQTVEKR